MARHLIQALATDFEPTKFENEYHKQVVEMINKKAEPAIEQKSFADPGKVVDLMAALEASLTAIKKTKAVTPTKKLKKQA